MSESRVIDGILEASKKEAEEILYKCKKEADEIIKEAKEKIEKEEQENLRLANEKAEQLKSSIKSSVKTNERNEILKVRYEEIEKTIAMLPEFINSLSDEKYFEFMDKMMSRSRTGEKGECFVNARDKKRLPKGFLDKYKELNLSSDTVDIDGGFILKYGDIFINCDINKVIEEKKEELVDLIYKEMFA